LIHEDVELFAGLLIVMPLTSEIFCPFEVVAVAAPFAPIVTEAIVPLVEPSAEVTDFPMTLSAWDKEEDVNIALREVFVCTCCSTCEKDAN